MTKSLCLAKLSDAKCLYYFFYLTLKIVKKNGELINEKEKSANKSDDSEYVKCICCSNIGSNSSQECGHFASSPMSQQRLLRM